MEPTFIITSALSPDYGTIHSEERFNQTLLTLDSIQKKSPNCATIFIDSSPRSVDASKIETLQKRCTHCVELGNKNPGFSSQFSDRPPFTFLSTLKAITESYALLHGLIVCKVNKIDKNSSRIFKISGRYYLNDKFDIAIHMSSEYRGKYLIKNPEASWAYADRYIYQSRLWSFCPSLINETMSVITKIMCMAVEEGEDLEHCLYRCLAKEKVAELEHTNVEGVIASTGRLQID